MAGQAAGVLKHEFESWLAGVVQIGDQEREDAMAPKGAMATEGQLNGSLIQATASMLADYSKVASSFEDAVRLMQSLEARQQDHGKLVESVMQTLSRVGAGLDALTDGVTKTVATELAATRVMVTTWLARTAETPRLLADGHAGTSVQFAAGDN